MPTNREGTLGAPSIQILPQGLLGFLGIKNGGQFPQSLMRDLAPTLDLLNLYLEANSEVVFQLGIDPSVGTTGALTVPQNQFWALLDVTADLVQGVGEGQVTSLCYRIDVAGNLPRFKLTDYQTGLASSTNVVGMAFKDGPIFLPPGAVISTINTSMTGTPTVDIYARIARMLI